MVLRIPFLIELELEMLVLGRGGKTGVKGEKPLGTRWGSNNKLNPDMASTPGPEPRLLWWEARALTTPSPLAQIKQCDLFSVM